MNKGEAITGGILMVLGSVLFIIGYPMTQDPLLIYGRIISTVYEIEYIIAWIMALGGGGMAVGGLALLIYGVSVKPSSKEDIENYITLRKAKRGKAVVSPDSTSHLTPVYPCPICGKIIPRGKFKFCPHCGASLDGSPYPEVMLF